MALNPNVTQLDQQQIIQRSFDSDNDRLRVDAEVSVVIGTIDVNIQHTEDSIRLGDGTNYLTSSQVSGKNGLDVNIINSTPIPVTIPGGLSINIDAFNSTPDNILLVGSQNGTTTGNKYGFVNNERQQILAAHDREDNYTWADFGLRTQRVTRIDYTSSTFSGITVRKDFTYSFVNNNYQLDTVNWSIV